MKEGSFYMAVYGSFGDGRKATQRSLPDKGVIRKGIGKVAGSGLAYVYLFLTSQVQKRSGIVDNSVPAVDV